MSSQKLSPNNPFASNDENTEQNSATQSTNSNWNPFTSPSHESQPKNETKNDDTFDPFEDSKANAKKSEWATFSPDGKMDDSRNPFYEIDKANRPQEDNPFKEKNKQVMEEFVNKVKK